MVDILFIYAKLNPDVSYRQVLIAYVYRDCCSFIPFSLHQLCSSGASCSKFTMSLVNDSLKFQMAILQYTVIFC